MTVIEYGDYECPYCRGAAPDVHLLLDEYPGMVRLLFRNFPVLQLHPYAERAAASQGKFWEMHGLLLRPASRLDVDSLYGYAGRLGLDIAWFRSDLASHAYAMQIERDMQEGIRNGVNATPKFYVNDQRIDGKLSLESRTGAVRMAVAATSRTLPAADRAPQPPAGSAPMGGDCRGHCWRRI